MTLEQTTQLVQLILNAAVMVVASGLMLGVANQLNKLSGLF